jgi:hypothetical protein
VLKTVFRIKFEDDDSEGYLVINPQHRSYYNLDGVIHAREPAGWIAVANLGEVKTADDFERLTGSRHQVFVEDCRACNRPALLFVDEDGGLCVDCQGGGRVGEDAVN